MPGQQVTDLSEFKRVALAFAVFALLSFLQGMISGPDSFEPKLAAQLTSVRYFVFGWAIRWATS